MAKEAKVKPTYLTGKKPVKIQVHDVANILKMIDDHGHSAKFKRQAKKAGAFMMVDPDTVNFVKNFVADNNMHAHPVGKKVVNPAPAVGATVATSAVQGGACPNFECKFGSN
jgi:hypothetical protein